MFMLSTVYILLFLSEIISFLHYSTMQKPLLCLQQISINKPPFACNNNQNSHTLFRLKLNFKQYRPGMQQYKSKSNFISPAFTTNNSVLINPP